MPWSPIRHFSKTLEALREKGYVLEVPVEELRKELMRQTGVINMDKIGQYIKTMEYLGMITRISEKIIRIQEKQETQ